MTPQGARGGSPEKKVCFKSHGSIGMRYFLFLPLSSSHPLQVGPVPLSLNQGGLMYAPGKYWPMVRKVGSSCFRLLIEIF